MEEDRSYGEATAAKARGTAWRGAGGGREGAQGCKELSRSSVVSGQKECRLERRGGRAERTCGSVERGGHGCGFGRGRARGNVVAV